MTPPRVSSNPPSTDPPRFTEAERQDIYAQLRSVQREIKAMRHANDRRESVEDHLHRVEQSITAMSERVDAMFQRDLTQGEKLTLLEQRMAALGAHHGGIVGGVVGEAKGREAGREAFTQRGAFYMVLVMLVSGITTGIIHGVQTAFTPIRPTSAQTAQPK